MTKKIWRCVTHEGCEFSIEWDLPKMTPAQLNAISDHKRGPAIQASDSVPPPTPAAPKFELTMNEVDQEKQASDATNPADQVDTKIQEAMNAATAAIIEQVRISLTPLGTAVSTLSGRLSQLEAKLKALEEQPEQAPPFEYQSNGQNGRYQEQPEVAYDPQAYRESRPAQAGGIGELITQIAPLLKAFGILGQPAPAAPVDAIAGIRNSLNTVAELVNVVNGLQLSTSEVRLQYQREVTEAIKTAQMAGADPDRVVEVLNERAEAGLEEIRKSRRSHLAATPAETEGEGNTA